MIQFEFLFLWMFISDALYDFTLPEGDQGNNDHGVDGSNYSLIWQLFFESSCQLHPSEIHKIPAQDTNSVCLNPVISRNDSLKPRVKSLLPTNAEYNDFEPYEGSEWSHG